jgi:hypothetical protein
VYLPAPKSDTSIIQIAGTSDRRPWLRSHRSPIPGYRGVGKAPPAEGQQVYAAGRLRTRSWQDENEQTHYRTEVQAEQVIFLDTRQAQAVEVQEEDLPADLDRVEHLAEQPRKRPKA